jgi:hypothetical protein
MDAVKELEFHKKINEKTIAKIKTEVITEFTRGYLAATISQNQLLKKSIQELKGKKVEWF